MLGKIKSIQGAGDFDSKFGKLYKFKYEMESGESLTANHKTNESPFKVGDEVNYEITGGNDYGNWGKVSKPEDQYTAPAGGNRDDLIVKQTCIKAAAEFCAQSSRTPQQVMAIAAMFHTWVTTGEMPLDNVDK